MSIILPTTPLRMLYAMGDSITANANNYVSQFKPNVSPNLYCINYAVPGSTLLDITNTQMPKALGGVPATIGGRKFIASIMIGTNGLAGYAGATDAIAATNFLTDLATEHARFLAVGGKTVAITITPISGQATHNARRALVNAEIVANWVSQGKCTAVADFGGDSIMGTDTSFTDNPTYWTDGTHPSTLGWAKLETIYRPAVNGI